LCHGGRFSAAIFQGQKEIVHKGFSRYVVRKKQGGRQGARGPKTTSAGSWLRNFHEQKLHDEIIVLLNEWGEHLASCDKIFVHAPGVINMKTIFHEDSPLVTEDGRIQKVPISTRKPKFDEVKRVYSWLGQSNFIESN